MSIGKPTWFDEVPDWKADKEAWNSIRAKTASADPQNLHRAIRHHNWREAQPPEVQHWINCAMHDISVMNCRKQYWFNLKPISKSNIRFVSHRYIFTLKNLKIKKNILQNHNDRKKLLTYAQEWDRTIIENDHIAACWLCPKDTIEKIASFDQKNIHTIIASLGLFHFGQVPSGADGAVLRVEYELDADMPLYKPDWRHGYPNFYWATPPQELNHGMTRNLLDGKRICPELIIPFEKLEPQKHLVAAQCVFPKEPYNHYDLPDRYWKQLQSEIK